MKPSKINHSVLQAVGSDGVSVCNGELVEIGHALKQQITECFEEGIQALRREHKNAESWILGLRQEVQKSTDEISDSCEQIRSELDQFHNIIIDMMTKRMTQRSTQRSVSTDDTHIDSQVGAGPTDLNRQSQTEDRREKIRNVGNTQELIEKVAMSETLEPDAGQSTPRGNATIHIQMLEKVESEHKRKRILKRKLETHLSCYHSYCVPACMGKLVHSAAFNNLCALVTILFGFVVGLEADSQIRSALHGNKPLGWVEMLVHFFNIWFVGEVALRIVADGVHYFIDHGWRWNIFDLLIAMLSLVDLLADTGAFGFMRLVRAVKIAKALRVVRLLRLLDDLRLLIASMLASVTSLLWSFGFLIMVIYLSAVTFVQAAAAYVTESEQVHAVRGIQLYYDTIGNAMYTLVMCISGGIDWFEAADPIWHLGWVYGSFFVGYILFCVLGILNVITSVFVENAKNLKKHDQDFAVSEELKMMEEHIEETMDFFEELVGTDVDAIKQEDLEACLCNKRVIAHFAAIGIEISDPVFIAHALGGDSGGGPVDTRAFVRGCISLRGPAKQSDTLCIISHVRRLEAVLDKMVDDTAENFKLLALLAAKSSLSGREEIKRWKLYGKSIAEI